MKYAHIIIQGAFNKDSQLPIFKGSMLRGALGHAFKSTVCAVRVKECNSCLLRSNCVYARLFEVKPDPSRHSGLSSLPHPYVLDSSLMLKKDYEANEVFQFGLTLFGSMIELLPYFVYSFIEMGKRGWTKQQHSFQILKLESSGKTIYRSDDTSLIQSVPEKNLDFSVQDVADEVILHLETPLRFKHERKFCSILDEIMLLRVLNRRFRSLWRAFDDCDPSWPEGMPFPKPIPFKITETDIHWREHTRYSNRQQAEHKFGGIIGKIKLQGNLSKIIPLLKVAEITHLGKETSFGLGKIKVEEG